VACDEIALQPYHVIENFIGLVEDFDDVCDIAVGISPLGKIEERRMGCR
jgi:hypothetical protein